MPPRGNHSSRTSDLNHHQKKQREFHTEIRVGSQIVNNSSFFTPRELHKERFAKTQNVNNSLFFNPSEFYKELHAGNENLSYIVCPSSKVGTSKNSWVEA